MKIHQLVQNLLQVRQTRRQYKITSGLSVINLRCSWWQTCTVSGVMPCSGIELTDHTRTCLPEHREYPLGRSPLTGLGPDWLDFDYRFVI